MKKVLMALMCMTGLVIMTACGGGTKNERSTGDATTETSGQLADGKWPASVYDKYGIGEIPTKGRIVFTDFANDGSYQYRVAYKDVTKDEVLAWVGALKEKGFRISALDEERLNQRSYDHDIMIYQAEEGKDMRMRLSYDWKNDMSFEYYYDEEPNPAFEVVTREGEGDTGQFIDYNFEISLNPIDNAPKSEGSIEALGLTASDFQGVDHLNRIILKDHTTRPAIGLGFYGDHVLTEADLKALHEKVADVLAAKGAKFTNTLSGKELTAEQLKTDGVRSYTVELNGKKFMMMAMSESTVGQFGGSVNLMFTAMK